MPTVRFNIVVFWVVQWAFLLVFTAPFEWSLVGLLAATYFPRMLGITLGFHRHLAHASFETSRPVRFFWLLLGTAAMQKGPLWWAAHHVNHHRYSDRDEDPHSPKRRGFYYAHMGWFLENADNDRLDHDSPVVRRFGQYPEVRWLERFYGIPPLVLAALLFAAGGWPWLVWGYGLSTALLAHCTFAINTVNHLFGSRRFDTRDDSTNNPVTALLALGEGWHNNHHRYQRAARNGFYWWEWDPTYYVIRAMGWLRLAWAIVPVPGVVYREADERRSAERRAEPPAFELASDLGDASAS